MIRDKISAIIGFPIRGNYKASLNTLDISGAVDKKKQLEMILALCESVEELEMKATEGMSSVNTFDDPKPKPTNKKRL